MSASPAVAAPAPTADPALHRAARGLALAAPLLLSVFFLPAAESPFLLPKRSLLIVLAFAAFALEAGWRGTSGVRSPLPENASSIPGTSRLRLPDLATRMMLAALPLATGLAWLTSPRRDLGGQAVLFAVSGPLLAWSAAALAKRGDSLLRAMALAGALQSALALLQWLTPLDLFRLSGQQAAAAGRMRLFGTLGNPDFLAIFVAATLPAASVLARRARGAARALWLLATLLGCAAIAGSGSRTAVFAAVAGVVMAAALDRGSARSAWMTAAAVVLVLLAGTQWHRNPRPLSTAAQGRAFVWRVALAAGEWKLPLGRGPGTFAYRYPARLGEYFRAARDPDLARFAGLERTANNDFVQALAESGWLGLLALAATLALALLRLAADPPAFGTVVALCAAALAESPFQRAETWALLWLCVALGLRPSRPRARLPGRLVVGVGSASRLVAPLLFIAACWFAVRPVLADLHAGRGARLESQALYEPAIASYRRAIALGPSSTSAPFNLPRALALAGDLDAAARAAADAVRWIDEPETHLLQVRILEARGDRLAAFQRCLAAAPRFPYSAALQQELVVLASRLPLR